MNEETVKALRPVVLGTYVGEECQGCRMKMTFPQMGTAVWWPWERGRIGHPDCYAKAQQRKLFPHE